MLFVRHTLNNLQNSSHSQAVEWRGYGHSTAGVQLGISAGTNPCDTSVSTAFQHGIVIHYTSLLFRQQFPQRTTDLITLCKAARGNARKSPGVRIQLWGSPCPGTGLQTPRRESGCPSAPGTSTPGLRRSCTRMGYPRGTNTPRASRGGHTPGWLSLELSKNAGIRLPKARKVSGPRQHSVTGSARPWGCRARRPTKPAPLRFRELNGQNILIVLQCS